MSEAYKQESVRNNTGTVALYCACIRHHLFCHIWNIILNPSFSRKQKAEAFKNPIRGQEIIK